MPHKALVVAGTAWVAFSAVPQGHAWDGRVPSPRAYAMDAAMAPELVHPCSRPGPYLGRDATYWRPSEAQIEQVERAVDEAIDARKAEGKLVSPLPLSAHIRRYIGITTDRGLFIHGHIITPRMLSGTDPETLRTHVCHAGVEDWGIDFEVASNTVTDIWFSAGDPPGSRPR